MTPETQHHVPKISDAINLISSSLPLLTVALIIIGFYNVHNYYSLFDIEIQNYLDPSEIIFSFSAIYGELVTILLYSGVMYVLWDVFSLRKRFPRILILSLLFLAVGIGMLLISVTIRFIDVFNFGITEFVVLVTFITVFAAFREMIHELPERFHSRRLIIESILGLFCLIAYITLRNYIIARGAISPEPKYQIVLDHDLSKVPISSIPDSIAYIGSVKNYHFLINLHTSEVFTVPASQAKSVKLKKLREGL